MKTIILTFLLQLITAHATPVRPLLEPIREESNDRAPLYLEVGEQRVLSFPKMLRFSVSGESIRHTRMQNKIFIKALKPGIAQLEIVEGSTLAQSTATTRLIRVDQKKAFTRSADFLQALSHLRSIEAIDAGKHFVIRGKIDSPRDAHAVAVLRQNFNEQIIDETELDSKWSAPLRAQVEKLVGAYPKLELQSLDTGLVVRGSVTTLEVQKDVERKVRAILPLVRFDIQTIRDQNATLYFKVYLLEMKHETMRSFGIKWPKEHPLSLQVASFDNPQWSLGGPTKIDLSIQAMSQKGQARVLSSPELVVRCPGQAELFAGGELPIRQLSKFTDSVTWKHIGLSLKLDVKEYGADKVRLNIETEISHRDDALMNDKIPGIKSNRIKTQVDATLGRPLFLSGLLQEDWRKSFSGVAGLAEIPILGALFRSEDFQNERSELVAILVPSGEPPSEPITRIDSGLPLGFLPLPRRQVNADKIEALKSDSDYPWNALE